MNEIIDWSDKAMLKRNQDAVTDLHSKWWFAQLKIDNIRKLIKKNYEEIEWLEKQKSEFCRGKIIGIKEQIWLMKEIIK